MISRILFRHIHIISENEKYVILLIFNRKIKLPTIIVNKVRILYRSTSRIYRQKIRHEKLSYRTYNDLACAVKCLIQKLPADITMVVGIPRSGMIPAYMIGAFLNIKVASLDEYLSGINVGNGERLLTIKENQNTKILIIDDSISSGLSLHKTKERISNSNMSLNTHIYSAVYAIKSSRDLVDYYGEVVEQPRLFQWNYLHHHGILSKTCVDIDGVLCVDPTVDENDDGEEYIKFLKSAKPLYIPRQKIYALVTSRLEKYRPETEEWLEKHGVKYDKLYMLNLSSAEERRALGVHAEFKASIYKSISCAELFIESEESQAEKIASLSRKPVICSTTDRYFSGKEISEEANIIND